MSDTKHTPGPWKVYGTPGEWPGIDSDTTSIVIYGEDGNFERGIRGESNEEAFANARFIVRAVNSHYAMLEACEATLAIAFKHEAQYWLDAPRTDAEKLAQIVRLMRTAIADAKGQTP